MGKIIKGSLPQWALSDSGYGYGYGDGVGSGYGVGYGYGGGDGYNDPEFLEILNSPMNDLAVMVMVMEMEEIQ